MSYTICLLSIFIIYILLVPSRLYFYCIRVMKFINRRNHKVSLQKDL